MAILEFQTGKATCAWEPGKFCKFIGSKSYGTKPFCTLFLKEVRSSIEESGAAGWLQRLPECVALDEPRALSEDGQHLIDHLDALDEFTRLADGFLYWFPESVGCSFSEYHLRTIALYLEVQNQPLSGSLDVQPLERENDKA